ncbi:MAG: hypothetical protein E4H09_03615, partial [Spirochaetales bacterium]
MGEGALRSPPSPELQLFSPDAEGRFLERPNRFVIDVELDGIRTRVHCPNPGRMTELLVPGATILLERAQAPVARTPQTRRTAYTAAAVIHGEAVVSLIPV